MFSVITALLVTIVVGYFILKKYKDHGTVLSKKKEDEREMITP